MADVLTIGPCTLVHADWQFWCWPDDLSAVLTDPPYGIGYVKGETGRPSRPGGSVNRSSAPICGDDELFDPAPILVLGLETLMWGADRYRSKLPPTGRFLAWDKLAGRKSWDSFGDVDFAWHSIKREVRK